MEWKQINIRILLIFIIVHAITLYCLLSVTFHIEYLYYAIGMYFFRWAAFTCCLHRYFSHRVCKTSRSFQFLLGLWGTFSMIRGPLTFASGHRLHHKYSDTPNDLHSIHRHHPLYAYLGWVINKGYNENKIGLVNDLKKYPELYYLNKYYYIPNLLLLYALYNSGGLAIMTWAGLVSILMTWHMAFSMTILFHKWGVQDYKTNDQSRNSFFLNLFTLGEGWHNNHHYNMSSASMGHKWWQIDPGYWVFWCLEKLGLVWQLKKP